MSPENEYFEIVGWSDFLHPDTTRKCQPPYRWCKLNTENLDVMGDLTLRDFGAYCRLLMLAATTNNQVIFNQGWIKRRTGVTQSSIKNLQKRNLIRIRFGEAVSQKSKQNQVDDEKVASVLPAEVPQSSSLEGKGEDRNRLDIKGIEGIRENALPELVNSIPLIPPRQARKKNGHDHRSFEELKSLILPIAEKLKTSDAAQIHLLAGQTLQMSPKQVSTAVKQLTEDGEL